jgi:hypothetical protein
MSEVEPRRFTRLPEPVPYAELRTSLDQPVPEEKDDEWREIEWMLRAAGS